MDDTPNWGIEPVPERLRVLGVFDRPALDEPRHLAARARRGDLLRPLSLKQALLATSSAA